MALVLADRVQDVTTTTGTGTITLANTPPTGFQSFAVIGNGNTTYYAIYGGNNWEVGIGTYTSIGTTLSRDTVLSSSNSNSLVSFGSGDKAVFVTYPSEKSVNEDAAGNVNISITGNAATATKAFNLNDGAAGSIPYQTASNTTAFVAAAAGVLVGGTTPSFSTTPTLTGTNFTGIPNAALTNNTVTLGTTSVALGATSLTLAGLTSVTLTQDPTLALQAATKQYVDTLAAEGISYHAPVKYEVPTALTVTYNNGTAGVGATLTNAGTQTAFTPDGVVASVADRILIYNQAAPAQNGVYTVTTVGSGSTNWVLTRATDANSYGVKDPNKLGAGDAFFVTSGNTGAGETYVCNTTGTITFGTTAITFVQISSAAIYSAGTGLTLTGTQFSLTTPVATTLGGTGLTTFGAANRAIFSSGTTTLTAGTLPTAAGGTGHTSYTDGQLLIGKSLDGTLEKATLTQGTGITIANGSGAITITNASPDQVVSLTNSGTTTVTGSYPNFNIASADQYVGTVTSVSGAGTVNGLTLTGTVTSTGSLTLGGTLTGVSLTTAVTGVLPTANGGTNLSSFTSGGAVYATTTSALTTGTLPVASGGTGTATAFTAGSVVFAGASGVYTQDTANFFWDDTNNFLGLGISTPNSRLVTVGHNEFSLGLTARTSSTQTAILNHPVAALYNSNTAAGNGLSLRYQIADTTGNPQTAGGIGMVATAKGASSVTADMYFYNSATEVARLTAAGYLEATYSDRVVALGNSGTATTINLAQGNVFTATLTGNCTFTLSGSNANSSRGSSFTLILTNDATAGRTVAWAGGTFRFPGGAATLGRTTAANAVDIWVFFTPNNGTTWYGNISMKNMLA